MHHAAAGGSGRRFGRFRRLFGRCGRCGQRRLEGVVKPSPRCHVQPALVRGRHFSQPIITLGGKRDRVVMAPVPVGAQTVSNHMRPHRRRPRTNWWDRRRGGVLIARKATIVAPSASPPRLYRAWQSHQRALVPLPPSSFPPSGAPPISSFSLSSVRSDAWETPRRPRRDRPHLPSARRGSFSRAWHGRNLRALFGHFLSLLASLTGIALTAS